MSNQLMLRRKTDCRNFIVLYRLGNFGNYNADAFGLLCNYDVSAIGFRAICKKINEYYNAI